MKKNTINSILIFLLFFGINFSFGQDTDSDIDGPNLIGQPNPITISSLIDTDLEAIHVFDFDIYDYGTSDGLNTDITQITIKSGTNNNTDWSTMLQGVKISKDGGLNFVTIGIPIITTNTITIPITAGNLVITDGNLETISLFIYLNNTSIIENKIFEFKVDGNNHGFTTATTGSSQFSTIFTGTTPSPVSNQININVEATELQFTQQPTDVEENMVMTPAVTVIYTDANGNIDVDYDGLGATATLTALGGATLAATTTTDGTPTNGEMTFNNIEFTGPATGVTLVITDSAGITTPTITSTAFDVFLVINTDTEVYDATQPLGTTISSITNTDANNAVDVFKMTIEDQASGDGLSTKVTNIRIKPHTTNTAIWSNVIQGILMDDGINFLTPTAVNITDAFIDITLANTDLVIADGGTKDIAIAVYLNTSNIIDNDVLSFMVEGVNHGFTADTSGSDFASSFLLGNFNSNDFTVDVEATELQFTQQPTDVEENMVMTPAVTVIYTDANGNIDVDYDGLGATATLTALGGATLAATTTTDGTPTNGEMTFNNIEFTGPTTGVTLVITDSAGITTPTITSAAFDITAAPIGCSELFFSEYIEGSSNNKYLEIFNPTTASINLTDYQIVIYSNGNSTPSTTISFTTGALIHSNNVYVIEHSSANIWSGTPNQTVGNLSFNGSDAVVLRKLGANIDVIGTIGSSANFGIDKTLVRKKTVAFPNTNYDTLEWDSLTQDIVTGLGTHLSNCPCTGITTYTTASGWSNGVPNETTKALFTDSYNTGTANINACRCEVGNGATLTIAAGSYLKVLDSITNKGIIHVLNQGSVVQIYDNATVNGTGTFNTDITTTNLVDGDRFTYFSSPAESTTLNSFNAWADMGYLWNFVGATQDWSHITDVNTVMIPATGYIVQPTSSTTNATPTTTFTGPFNNGIKTHPMYFEVANAPDSTDASSSLVGNPYPSAINSNLLFQKNAQLGGIYIWNHDSAIGGGATSYGDWVNNDYIVCASNLNCTNAASSGPNATHSGYIASGQGFFATANVASPADLVFDNSMRDIANNTDFRRPINSNTEKLWLNLTSTIGYFNQSLFVFSENGTPSYNNQADAKRLGSNYGISIYSLTDTNDRLAVDNRGVFQNDITIPLGYYVNNDNVTNLTFSIDHFKNLEDTNVYLKDNLLNTIHDLKIANYVFNTSTGTFNTRFELLFSRTILAINDTNIKNNDNLIITNINNTQFEVKMLNNSKIINFKAYDLLGKLIVETNPNLNHFKVNTTVNKGTIIFVKVSLENGQTLAKKFLKN